MGESYEDAFERVSREVLMFLNEHHHPHTSIIATPTTFEVLEGTKAITTDIYVRD